MLALLAWLGAESGAPWWWFVHGLAVLWQMCKTSFVIGTAIDADEAEEE